MNDKLINELKLNLGHSSAIEPMTERLKSAMKRKSLKA